MLKILVLGDVVGSPGRKAIRKFLPEYKKKNKLDLVIVNVDNITHGMGPTREKIEEMVSYGVDLCTNGDHTFRFKNFYNDLDDTHLPVIRPANYPDEAPGRGYEIIDLGQKGQVLVINLMGQVFLRDTLNSPFSTVDQILKQFAEVPFAAKIVDFHAEATSEKRALGFYLDGKVSAVLGTHTHIQTADAEILPQKTAYLSDLGMVGPFHSILGEKVESVLTHYLQKTPHRYQLEESGKMALNGVLLTVGSDGLASSLKCVNLLLEE